jgi:3-oxoacyl-[acyl-carrier-protein] synthase II
MVTPIGLDVSSTWQNLLAGHSGISRIKAFELLPGMPCEIAGQVPSDFTAAPYISPKDEHKMDRFIVLAMAAAVQAVEDSGWMPTEQEDLEMTGVMIGSGIGGLRNIEQVALQIEREGVRRVSPFIIPSILINLASGHLSIKYGFQGPNHSVVTACSTGAHAIGDAARIIASGDADVMVAGGAESCLSRVSVVGFSAARALSTHFNDRPQEASRPWDKDRDGFVMGEGAGIVVLEEYEHAKKRGAKIYGELLGYGLTGDGYHITAPHPEGRGGYRSMAMALRKSGLDTSDIGYVNAHGTSTPLGDEIELRSVQRLFASDLDKVSMSSTKSSIGHLLGAAGSVEAIFSLLAMRDSVLPPTLNLNNPLEEARIDLVPHTAREKQINAVMTNSFGFGGTNATLVFGKV